MFDHTSSAREASRALFNLQQRNRRVVDYAVEFRTLAADSGWDDVAIRDTFVNGLTEQIKDHLAPMELPGNLESLVDMATRIDNRLHERERERRQLGRRSSEGRGALRGLWQRAVNTEDPSRPCLRCQRQRHLLLRRNPCSWAGRSWLQRNGTGG
ncbi:hypothetical protein L3Q82_006044 [Scortum barcoo]|uniref:Uncharacterized protein n=1 Tax=Scortum barcoo TaxID=214431 RepID=A0ACB8X2B8_9TELE|nr:hypothetical protein L3Q82_006044 [Scortum barcoo]